MVSFAGTAWAQPAVPAPAPEAPAPPETPQESLPAIAEEGVKTAQEQAEAARAERERFDEKLVLDTGRIPVPEPTKTSAAFAFRGEFQLRYRANNTLPLHPPLTAAGPINLGQNHYMYQYNILFH